MEVIQIANTVERIEQLIAIAQRRSDTVFGEIDRHRFIRGQLGSVQNVVEGEYNTITPTVPKIANRKVA